MSSFLRFSERAAIEALSHASAWQAKRERWLERRRKKWASRVKEMSREMEYYLGYGCSHCGSMEDLTLDHIWPLSRGGSDHEFNLQWLCRSCNSRKGDSYKEWYSKSVVSPLQVQGHPMTAESHSWEEINAMVESLEVADLRHVVIALLIELIDLDSMAKGFARNLGELEMSITAAKEAGVVGQ